MYLSQYFCLIKIYERVLVHAFIQSDVSCYKSHQLNKKIPMNVTRDTYATAAINLAVIVYQRKFQLAVSTVLS
jgi:hypothetical protein